MYYDKERHAAILAAITERYGKPKEENDGVLRANPVLWKTPSGTLSATKKSRSRRGLRLVLRHKDLSWQTQSTRSQWMFRS